MKSRLLIFQSFQCFYRLIWNWIMCKSQWGESHWVTWWHYESRVTNPRPSHFKQCETRHRLVGFHLFVCQLLTQICNMLWDCMYQELACSTQCSEMSSSTAECVNLHTFFLYLILLKSSSALARNWTTEPPMPCPVTATGPDACWLKALHLFWHIWDIKRQTSYQLMAQKMILWYFVLTIRATYDSSRWYHIMFLL